MKEKKIGRIIKTLIIVVIISFCSQVFFSQVFAADTPKSKTVGIGDILKAGTRWIDGAEKLDDTEVEDFVTQFSSIGQILVIAGIVTILIVIIVTAIKWITATPDKQAQLKKQLVGLVVSAIVLFGAIGIWNFIRGAMQNVEEKLQASKTSIVVANCDVNINTNN